jgi:hypothetical protein
LERGLGANIAASIAARMALRVGAEPIMASMTFVVGSKPTGIGRPEFVNILALNMGMGRLCIEIIVLRAGAWCRGGGRCTRTYHG